MECYLNDIQKSYSAKNFIIQIKEVWKKSIVITQKKIVLKISKP